MKKLFSPYKKPEYYPKKGEHPRVLFNKESLKSIRANLTAEENRHAYAEYLRLSELPCDGTLPPPREKTYNMDYSVLAAIEAKAFRYALTGEKHYGCSALSSIKNYLSSVVITEDIPDSCRAYGYIMYITACVYDWCYDLLTGDDCEALVYACQTLLAPHFEVGFPPTKQGAVTGHGTEAQLTRDWLSLGIAAYDEYPDIYELSAGRLFEQFRPVGEFYLASGSHWQGSSYGPYRYHFMLYTQALMAGIGKPDFYSPALAQPALTFINYIRPDGEALRVGDDFNELSKSYNLRFYYNSLFLAAAIYKNPVVKGFAKQGLKDFSLFQNENNSLSAVAVLILNDPDTQCKPLSELPTYIYNGSPLGSIISRTKWNDENAVMTYMKIGEAYSANHEHKDAGTFQIFYKGILASDSGIYDGYGSPHDFHYNKQTVAANSLLIFNPNMPDASEWNYCGGQTIAGSSVDEKDTLEEWLSESTSRQAKIIGNGCDEKFAYLAGDLTCAYDSQTAQSVIRHMFSAHTQSSDYPLVFAVYDSVTAVEPSYKKTFLLHTQAQPQLDGTTASLANNGGRLVVQSLLSATEYTAVGGEGQEFVAAGINYPPNKTAHELSVRSTDGKNSCAAEAGWGRIEISPKGENKTDELLTVMYVTDESNTEPIIRAQDISTQTVAAAEIFNTVIAFSRDRNNMNLRLEVRGEGELNYYILGIECGKWEVEADGKTIGTFAVDEKRLLHFSAGGGIVSLKRSEGEDFE